MMIISAQRCHGHCLANHAYVLFHMGDVDEARVIFDKARDLADRSGEQFELFDNIRSL
jgi:hypothetical protein